MTTVMTNKPSNDWAYDCTAGVWRRSTPLDDTRDDAFELNRLTTNILRSGRSKATNDRQQYINERVDV